MFENEYQLIQESFRKKLKNNPYAGFSRNKEEAYRAGVNAAMSILSRFYHQGSPKSVTAASLVDELMEREGVRTVILQPYQDATISESGPATILSVTD